MSKPLDVLGAPGWGEVDARGLIQPGSEEWALDWWVGASDRWHRASQEAAVRQNEVGAGAVVETRMKVPDGDAVQRVWAVAAGGGPAVAVVEVGNEAATAFAIAMVVKAPGVVLTVDQGGVAVGGPAGAGVGSSPRRVPQSDMKRSKLCWRSKAGVPRAWTTRAPGHCWVGVAAASLGPAGSKRFIGPRYALAAIGPARCRCGAARLAGPSGPGGADRGAR